MKILAVAVLPASNHGHMTTDDGMKYSCWPIHCLIRTKFQALQGSLHHHWHLSQTTSHTIASTFISLIGFNGLFSPPELSKVLIWNAQVKGLIHMPALQFAVKPWITKHKQGLQNITSNKAACVTRFNSAWRCSVDEMIRPYHDDCNWQNHLLAWFNDGSGDDAAVALWVTLGWSHMMDCQEARSHLRDSTFLIIQSEGLNSTNKNSWYTITSPACKPKCSTHGGKNGADIR